MDVCKIVMLPSDLKITRVRSLKTIIEYKSGGPFDGPMKLNMC